MLLVTGTITSYKSERYPDIHKALMFGWQFMITYTIARTLSSKYHYDAWRIGFTSLAYGIGEFFTPPMRCA